MLPSKLIVFAVVGGFLWTCMAPKRGRQVVDIFREKRAARFEDSIHTLVEEKIRKNICTWQDMCSYRGVSWDKPIKSDANGAEVIHRFYTDGSLREVLFRVRYDAVTEVIDLR